MKKVLLTLLSLVLCFGALGCQGETFANHVAASDVAMAAVSAIGLPEDYIDGTADYFAFYFEGNAGADAVVDASMLFHRETTNVNELGVLRVASERDAAAVEQLARNYLAEQTDYLRGFAQNYSPEDMTKIDNADVCVMGCYVIYYILSPDQEAAALDAVCALLKTN